LRLGRQVEEVGGDPDRLEVLWRVGQRGEEGADSRERSLGIARASMLEPDAMYRIADGLRQPLLEGSRIVRRVGAGR
jgi:hypothetical protein